MLGKVVAHFLAGSTCRCNETLLDRNYNRNLIFTISNSRSIAKLLSHTVVSRYTPPPQPSIHHEVHRLCRLDPRHPCLSLHNRLQPSSYLEPSHRIPSKPTSWCMVCFTRPLLNIPALSAIASSPSTTRHTPPLAIPSPH